MVEIPVKIVNDPTIEDVMKDMKKNYFSANTYKTEKNEKKLNYVPYLCFVLGILAGFFSGYALYQYRYADLTNKIDKLATMNDEMQWRTQQIKEHIQKNQEISDKYEKESQETIDEIEKKIKNRKQKVVESN